MDKKSTRIIRYLGQISITTILILSISFCNRKSAREPFTFVQICDTQLGFGVDGYDSDLRNFTQAVNQINTINPSFVVICGDLVNIPGDTAAYRDLKNTIEKLSMPCYAASGNHDVTNKPNDSTLAFYRSIMGKDYYSVEENGYGIVIVNTQLWKAPVENETEAQDQWLNTSLKNFKDSNKPSIIVGHYPLFINGPDEQDQYYNLPVKKRKELLNLFMDSNVKAVLSGHTHKLVINNHEGMQLVSGETTSKNFDGRPFGFRLWTVEEDTLYHRFLELQKQ